MQITRGRDISNRNGAAAGLAAIHDPKTGWIYAKGTEGLGFVDPLYPTFYDAGHYVRKPVGPYGFLHPDLDGAAQARFLLEHTKPKPGDLKPVIDSETLHNGDWEQCAATTLAALRELDAHGTGGIGYASSSFIRQLAAHEPALKSFGWWYADYATVLWRIPGVRALLWQNTDRLGVGRFATDGDVLLARSLAAIEIPAHAIVRHPAPKPAPAPQPKPKPKPKPKAKPKAKKPAVAKRRYYTLKRNVPLKKGQRIAYQPGKGYYARTAAAKKA